jgi:hypothetical protein
MKRALLGAMVLAAGLSLAQGGGQGAGMAYRQEAMAAMALARLQTVAQQATGEEKLLAWAKEVKARAEKSYGAKEAFKALRQAQAALVLFRAAQGEPPRQGWAPGPRHGFHGAPGRPGMGMRQGRPFGGKELKDPTLRAQALVDRAEKELDYYRGQDPLVRTLIAEAKGRLEKEPYRASLLARAALALISAERGF